MGLKEAALRLGIIGLVQFVPLFLLTLVTGWTADRVDRRWIARASVALELGCARRSRLVRLDAHDDARSALHRRRAARRRPRVRRPGARRARAQSGSARDPAPRDRPVLDRLADRRDPRPCARRLSLRLRALCALCGERAAVRHRFRRPARHPAGSAHRDRARPQPVGADGRRTALRPPQPARARRDQPRPVRGAARRRDRDAAGVRARRASRRARRAWPSCAPRRRSARR